MPRKQKVPDSTGDIPAWFMTYSDVITLLMTFFILLLTFATDEPESFERMQSAMFGGGGATGLAGPNPEGLDNDALILRVRPKSGRQTTRGSEMPPLESDPSQESLSKGLESLDQVDDLAKQQRQAIDISLAVLFDEAGELTPLAKQHARMLARQVMSNNLSIRLSVAESDSVESVIRFTQALAQLRVPPGRIEVGINGSSVDKSHLRITLVRSPSKG